MADIVQSSPIQKESAGRCFHCGQPIAPGVEFSVEVMGQHQHVCCLGCQAVCQAIVAGGLSDYYRHRESYPSKAAEDFQTEIASLGLYDNQDFQQSFVRPVAEGEREADLILEGINCAACVWLNERHLRALPGVLGVQVNYATHRAKVRWREGQIPLSAILAAVTSIGYRAYPYDPGRFEDVARAERQQALRRLFVAGFGMMQVMMYAYPVYIAGEGEMSPTAENIMRWASLVLTLPVVFYAAAPFFRRAWAGMWRLHFGMDFPVALGVGLSFVASAWAVIAGTGAVYFDSVTMFVFFLLTGRYLEMLARQRAARGGDALGRLVPVFARRLNENGELEEQVPVSALSQGDRVLIRPGEVIVVDGLVLTGNSDVDESWLSGESLPVAKSPGMLVLGGSVNGTGSLTVEATQVGESTRFASIRRLMERAAAERPRVVAVADRVASGFTWLLLALAVCSALWWWHTDVRQVLPIFVSVLVVSCPCALSLATPVSLTVAMHVLARRGVLVTRGHSIETLARTRHFVFDKTGTLTTGRLQVREIVTGPQGSRGEALRLSAALEQHSEHSIARAICALHPQAEAAEDVCIHPGEGVEATVAGQRYAIGRLAFAERLAGSQQPDWCPPAAENSLIYLVGQGQWLAVFVLADELRPAAHTLLQRLQAERCRVSILSGDAVGPVHAVAQQLGVTDVHAALLPEDKQALMHTYQQSGEVVAMVGDGVNDAPVLAQAHVSIAMAGGTELARHQADILLLNDDLARLVWGRGVAIQTMRIIRQNLLWALVYNLVAIPAAMAGWVSPWLAGVGMGLSSVLVVLNALRIARVEK